MYGMRRARGRELGEARRLVLIADRYSPRRSNCLSTPGARRMTVAGKLDGPYIIIGTHSSRNCQALTGLHILDLKIAAYAIYDGTPIGTPCGLGDRLHVRPCPLGHPVTDTGMWCQMLSVEPLKNVTLHHTSGPPFDPRPRHISQAIVTAHILLD